MLFKVLKILKRSFIYIYIFLFKFTKFSDYERKFVKNIFKVL